MRTRFSLKQFFLRKKKRKISTYIIIHTEKRLQRKAGFLYTTTTITVWMDCVFMCEVWKNIHSPRAAAAAHILRESSDSAKPTGRYTMLHRELFEKLRKEAIDLIKVFLYSRISMLLGSPSPLDYVVSGRWPKKMAGQKMRTRAVSNVLT